MTSMCIAIDPRLDEIRQFGMSSIQVLRRLRAALTGLAESTTIAARAEAVRRYLKHLDLVIERSSLDSEDKVKALQEDPQGLGLSRRRPDTLFVPMSAGTV